LQKLLVQQNYSIV